MGSFQGHALPGSIFICLALWWTIQISIRYFRSKYRNGQAYRSGASFPCTCSCGRLGTLQWEGMIKTFMCGLGIVLELTNGMKYGKFVYFANGQHATMYSAFALNGIVDITMHHSAVLPKYCDYATAVVGFIIEGVLFKFHVNGRPPLDVQVHTILVYMIAIGVLFLLAEMRWPENVLLCYSRTYFILLQGTWFWQVGFILYNPIPGAKAWNENDHNQMMMATVIFGWHMLLDLLLIMMIGLVVSCIVRRCCRVSVDDNLGLSDLTKRGENGHNFIRLGDNDEDVLEYDCLIQNNDGNKN